MTAWTDFVTKLFNSKRKHNKSYRFKNALVDASKIYNNQNKKAHKKHGKTNKKHRKTNKKHRMRGGQDEFSQLEEKNDLSLFDVEERNQNGGKKSKNNKSKKNKSNKNQ
jgi:hypothetical protein